MPRLVQAGIVSHASVATMISNVGRLAAGVPTQKETWPAMMMHGDCGACGRQGDLEHADKLIFKNNTVSARSGLHSVVAIREIRSVLGVDAKMPAEQHGRSHEQGAEKFPASIMGRNLGRPHAAEYI